LVYSSKLFTYTSHSFCDRRPHFTIPCRSWSLAFPAKRLAKKTGNPRKPSSMANSGTRMVPKVYMKTKIMIIGRWLLLWLVFKVTLTTGWCSQPKLCSQFIALYLHNKHICTRFPQPRKYCFPEQNYHFPGQYTRFKGNKSRYVPKSISYLFNAWSVTDIFIVQPPSHSF